MLRTTGQKLMVLALLICGGQAWGMEDSIKNVSLNSDDQRTIEYESGSTAKLGNVNSFVHASYLFDYALKKQKSETTLQTEKKQYQDDKKLVDESKQQLEQLPELKKQINNLSDAKANLEKEKESLTNNLKTATEKNNLLEPLKGQLEVVKQQFSNLEKEKNELFTKNSQFETSLETAKKEKTNLEKEKESLTNNLTTATNNNKYLSKQLTIETIAGTVIIAGFTAALVDSYNSQWIKTKAFPWVKAQCSALKNAVATTSSELYAFSATQLTSLRTALAKKQGK